MFCRGIKGEFDFFLGQISKNALVPALLPYSSASIPSNHPQTAPSRGIIFTPIYLCDKVIPIVRNNCAVVDGIRYLWALRGFYSGSVRTATWGKKCWGNILKYCTDWVFRMWPVAILIGGGGGHINRVLL